MLPNLLEHIFFFASLSVLVVVVQAVKYDFVVENEDVFTPCEDFPDKFIDKFFDISGLSFEREADLIKVTGDVKLIHEFDKAIPIQLDAQIYKRSRGEWVDTIYNIRRPDFCPTLYSENELWFIFTKVVPEQDRKCPPQPGLTISFDSLFGLSYDIYDRSAEGEYKLKVMIGQGRDIMCFEIESSVYKSD
ncbi:PREDICTED: uncharacterized protein LOC108978820 [Bactrocera latifrons]|nr:PREDICTED: uncharacterized protein LOC108978820 [Bactrocera latifrons]